METFRGKAHLPGADREWNVQLEIDWDKKEADVHIDEAPDGITDWPGLAVQTFGPRDEIVFRTKGIPPLFTHWWHFARSGRGDLWGIILGLPDVEGRWRICMIALDRIEQ
ncbi:MAG: hypothetical protein HYU85_08005 [Chloroflexi bacterium]|nr:hypothetical protein [Chloroflexota bacterium]MBI3930586.1 hypothetical protein [Chloroflexota bacterium]